MQVFHLGCMDRWIWKRNSIYLLKFKKKNLIYTLNSHSWRKDGRIFPEQLKSALNLKIEKRIKRQGGKFPRGQHLSSMISRRKGWWE